jgi:alanine dehydrogenase
MNLPSISRRLPRNEREATVATESTGRTSGIVFLDDADVDRLLPLSAAIDVVEDAFACLSRGEAINHPRSRVVTPEGVLAITGPAALLRDGVMGFKVFSTGKPPVHTTSRAPSAVALYDLRSGSLLAILSATTLSRRRTAAASAVSAKFMSRKDSRVVGLIGTGGQAVEQVLALALVRTIEEVRVFGRDPDRRAGAAAELSSRMSVAAKPVGTAQEAAESADIVVVITSSADPVLFGNWLRDGCHVIAAGSNYHDRRELDSEAVRRSSVIAVDALDQARIECGDLISADSLGDFDWARVTELGAIVTGSAPARHTDSDITLFESQGLGVLDIAAARHVHDSI